MSKVRLKGDYPDLSLSEVHETVDTNIKGSFWKRLLAFLGPAYLVSVGYMDPGNWATDLAGGKGAQSMRLRSATVAKHTLPADPITEARMLGRYRAHFYP